MKNMMMKKMKMKKTLNIFIHSKLNFKFRKRDLFWTKKMNPDEFVQNIPRENKKEQENKKAIFFFFCMTGWNPKRPFLIFLYTIEIRLKWPNDNDEI